MSQVHASDTNSRKRHPWLLLLVMVLIVIAVIPWLLAKTTLRDKMLNAIVNSDDVRVTSTNASFGYFTPLSLSGLQIRTQDDSTKIDVARIHADRSWLGLLVSRPELGTFRFDEPQIQVLVDPEKMKAREAQPAVENPKPATPSIELPNLAVEINDAAVTVRTTQSAEPPIDLQHIQLLVRLEKQTEGSVLRVEPTTVFDHQRITPELCGQGLQLIAPLLADEVDAEGEFSLRLSQFEIPIGVETTEQANQIQIDGQLQLHQASVGLRNTIAKGVSDLILKLVGIGAPDRLTVAKDLIVSFQVVDGRVRHEGLALLLPHGDSSVEIMSSGSVGLDETLDLNVAVKLPDALLGGNALVQRFTKDPIVLAITGTFDEPKVELASSSGLVKSIQEMIEGESQEKPSGNVTEDSVGEVVSEAVDIVGGLLQGLRQRADERDQERAEQEDDPAQDRSLLPNLRDRLRNRRRVAPESEPAPPAPEPPAPSPPSPAPPPEPIDL